MFIVPHKQETKQIVLNLFKKGLTATQVAVEANRLCRGTLNILLTKNSVMGIKNRAGKCIPRDPRNYTNQPHYHTPHTVHCPHHKCPPTPSNSTTTALDTSFSVSVNNWRVISLGWTSTNCPTTKWISKSYPSTADQYRFVPRPKR